MEGGHSGAAEPAQQEEGLTGRPAQCRDWWPGSPLLTLTCPNRWMAPGQGGQTPPSPAVAEALLAALVSTSATLVCPPGTPAAGRVCVHVSVSGSLSCPLIIKCHVGGPVRVPSISGRPPETPVMEAVLSHLRRSRPATRPKQQLVQSSSVAHSRAGAPIASLWPGRCTRGVLLTPDRGWVWLETQFPRLPAPPRPWGCLPSDSSHLWARNEVLVSREQKVAASWEATAPLCPCCRELDPAWWGEVSWGRAEGNRVGRPQATASRHEEGAAASAALGLAVCLPRGPHLASRREVPGACGHACLSAPMIQDQRPQMPFFCPAPGAPTARVPHR